MSIINTVFKTAETFMKNPKFVSISDKGLDKLSKIMIEEGKLDFFEGKNKEDYEGLDFTNEIKLELLASSINYCYWYGRPEMRPEKASSTLMYALLADSYSKNNRQIDMKMINYFVGEMATYRFPLIEERARHLVQTASRWERFVNEINNNKEDINPLVDIMIKDFPGFASDIFLKRAFLFFLQLNRKFGWFEKTINKIPIPADYQIPKMLYSFKVLEYSNKLREALYGYELIPAGSLMECEIRSATILACKKLSELTNWSTPEIDTFLWTKRKLSDEPFHLTITTSY
jgi:hypothetical protein